MAEVPGEIDKWLVVWFRKNEERVSSIEKGMGIVKDW